MPLFVNILLLFGRFRFTRIPVSNYKFAVRAIGIHRLFIGGVYIHIFMFCLTSFFSNQIQIDQFEFDLKRNLSGRT